MSLTNAYVAKAALIDLLQAQAGAGGPLDGVDVTYAFHGGVGWKSIYGGGFRFEQADTVAEPAVMVRELVTVGLYVRVVKRPACDVEETDLVAAGIAATVGQVLKANPKMAGGLSWVGISGGQGDYSRTDDETISVAAYQVLFGAHLVYG